MPEPLTLQSFIANFFAFFGVQGQSAYASLAHLAAQIWLAITIVGYVAAALGLGAMVYILMRLFDLRQREEEYYTTLIGGAAEATAAGSPRWRHIETLAASGSPSAWREAIIEADIMLDDLLAARGYAGAGTGEKLRQLTRADLAALDDAWEAHRVRNQIAHQGSAFDLSETLAARTLARYGAVFREWGAI